MTYLALSVGFFSIIMVAYTAYSLLQVSKTNTQITELLATLPQRLAVPTQDNGESQSLRLQAYERLSLLMERCAVQNLLLRYAPGEESANAYTTKLLLAIRNEFEYNVTQQVYVSDQLWQIILQARDNVSQLITRAAEGAESGKQVANRLRVMSQKQPADPIAMAQQAIRREAKVG